MILLKLLICDFMENFKRNINVSFWCIWTFIKCKILSITVCA